MDPRALQFAGPVDVVVFVETGFQFDQGHHLLAIFGGANQGRHHRRILGGAIEGHLDRQHRGVVGGLVEKFLHRGGEQVIGVMQQHITAADHGKNALEFLLLDRAVLQLAALGPHQGRHRSPLIGLVLQLGQGDCQQAHQIIKAQGTVDAIDVLALHSQTLHQ